MTLYLHELRQNRISLAVWTAAIALFMVACVVIYPEMETDMEEMGEMFASMGSFTAAFGMDRLNFGTLMGYYAIECGNVIGIGGAFFAALTGIAALAKEEKDHTAEFLLTHPVSRTKIISAKLAAVMTQVIVLNAVVLAASAGSIVLMDLDAEWKNILLMHLAYFLLQIELAGVCFGLSAFIRGGSLGAGLGFALVLYFMNLIKNITDEAEFLKYVTPFAYCDGADIVDAGSLDGMLVGLGMGYMTVALAIGFWWYRRKDIA
ncbi:MAG: ABC transporter permease subunit [Firmicutes bacterium]|nr:ABC transporter permease subunit [Bacillota bacterium]